MTNASVSVNPRQSLLAQFGSSRDGNISIIFGLSVLSIFTMVGGAVDFTRMVSAKSKVQAAMDSAALAGGRAMQLSNTNDPNVAIQAAQQYFSTMVPQAINDGVPVFNVVENSTVLRGSVNFSLPTPFLKLVGFPSLHSTLTTEAVLAAGGNAGTSVEVSMMLDTTGSMSGQKIEDLKAAAKDLVDIVIWQDQSTYTSKIALAPFAPRVNVGSYMTQITGMSATWSGKNLRPCVTERTGAQALTDAAPGSGAWLNAYDGSRSSNSSNYNHSGSCNSPSERVVPLTSDKDALKAHIDTFTDGGSTAGALGTAWAWYLLSPNWSSIWPTASTPRSYSDLTTLGPKGVPLLQKVAVLMTDGIYNTFGGSGADEATVSNHAISLCTNMKAAGIKVYTVGFQLGSDQLAIDTLKACASRLPNDPADQPSYFFNASSGDELKHAFRQIALQLATLRLRS